MSVNSLVSDLPADSSSAPECNTTECNAKQVPASVVFEERPPEPTFYFAQNLLIARKMNNRRATQVLGDIATVSWKRKRLLHPYQYFRYQMYEFAATSPNALPSYIDDAESTRLNTVLNRSALGRSNPVDDKLHMEAILRESSLPVTETQHVLIDEEMPFEKYSSDIDSGAKFFRKQARYPLFGKPNNSSRSVGVFRAEGFDQQADAVRLRGIGDVAVEELVSEINTHFGLNGFLTQTCLTQHPELTRIAGEAIGCVRVVTLRVNNIVQPLYGVWKVPSTSSVADNFWRNDNVVAAIDSKTGHVVRAQISSGIMGAEVEKHPDTDEKLIDMSMPHWSDALALAKSAASLFKRVNVIGWDIAITTDGPVIVEGNTNPDHGLYQLANGHGIKQSEFWQTVEVAADEQKKSKKDAKKDRKRKAFSTKFSEIKKLFSQGFSTSNRY